VDGPGKIEHLAVELCGAYPVAGVLVDISSGVEPLDLTAEVAYLSGAFLGFAKERQSAFRIAKFEVGPSEIAERALCEVFRAKIHSRLIGVSEPLQRLVVMVFIEGHNAEIGKRGSLKPAVMAGAGDREGLEKIRPGIGKDTAFLGKDAARAEDLAAGGRTASPAQLFGLYESRFRSGHLMQMRE
jgi:hypothetical protein